ncbi:MAG TPA: hypothetical protein VII19_08805 [Acidimicrobiales bacterium]
MIHAPHRTPHARRSTATRSTGGPRAGGILAALAAILAALFLLPGAGGAATPAAVPSATPSPLVSTYWLVASDGGVFSFGGLPNYGSMGGQHLNEPVVGMAATPDAGGYWLDASDGGIFSFGDAGFYGSMGGQHLNKPTVGMAATPDGKGYWLVASDGGIFSFGDAGFHGSTGALTLNKPVVGMAPTADGGGYWLVASDGGIFAFGDAGFHGSTGALTLQQPVVSMAATPDGGGYWLVASDGGVFAFGDAPFFGSTGGEHLSRPIVAMGVNRAGNGYWFTDTAGLVFNFGGAGYYGSAPPHLNQPVQGITIGLSSGASAADPSFPSGATGYDISNFQCNAPYPPGPYQIGVVQVTGASGGYINPCMASEAAWAGGGLNLYMYLTYDSNPATPVAICNGNTACSAGYHDAQFAFGAAQKAGVNTAVTWWLDVEKDPSWSSDVTANAAFVQGSLDGLRDEGVNNVGIYTSPLTWSGIVGSYQPQVPLWLAWYTGNPQQNCATGYSYAAAHGDNLPSGGIWITQYGSGTFDNDYAC